MINPLNSRSMLHLIGGFVLLSVSKVVEAVGDSFPINPNGVSSDRLVFHVAALGLVILAGYCFFACLRSLFGKQKPSTLNAPLFKRPASIQQDTGFDADAVMERYLANRSDPTPSESPSNRPEPPRPSFGRKTT
jgi:hypothetical protein